MPRPAIVIDAGLPAGRYNQPFRSGWLEATDVELRAAPSVAELRHFAGVALVDSVVAAALLDSWAILPGHAVASHRESMLNLVTDQRPDEIEQVVLATAGASESARALAEATLPRFYGITLTGWTDQPRTPDTGTVVLEEGAAALSGTEDDGMFHEDLGRAWFLLTQTPYVSHVCIAPRRLVEANPAGIAGVVATLHEARRLASERARELRRDLTREFGVDRELLVEVLNEQSNELGADELAGLKSLYSFSGNRAAADRLAGRIVEL